MQGHIHKLIGPWLQEHTDLRDSLVREHPLTTAFCRDLVHKLQAAVDAAGRDHPVPKLSERKLARLAREAAVAEAKGEQEREAEALQALERRAKGMAWAAGTAHAQLQAAEVEVNTETWIAGEPASRPAAEGACAASAAEGTEVLPGYGTSRGAAGACESIGADLESGGAQQGCDAAAAGGPGHERPAKSARTDTSSVSLPV